MSASKKRVFKLALPLRFERGKTELVIVDGFKNDHHSIALDKLEAFEIKTIDSDGFALFEVDYSAEHRKVTNDYFRPQAEAGVNGYTLFHSSVAKSTAYGHMKSNYEYYKRTNDLSFYALVKREGEEPAKIVMGSMFDAESRINQFLQVIYRNIAIDQVFDRKMLSTFLPNPLSYGRVMKCALDILVAEGFLFREEAPPSGRRGKGRRREVFRKTKKLDEFMVNPRSFIKPNGTNVGQ